MLTAREKSAKQALALIGADRFVSFIRFIQEDSDCIAVRLMSDALSTRSDISGIFLTGEEFGFTLSVIHIEDDIFHIAFGCQAGPLAGDGGEWEVQYDSDGSVFQVTVGTAWIS
jgi:hypothetical protein